VAVMDETGKRYGRLTVIERDHGEQVGTRYVTRWLCLCDCGAERSVIGTLLRNGTTRSCGCLRREVSAANATHGETGSDLHNRWSAMRERCSAGKLAYSGITVCKEWDAYEKFKDWATSSGYMPGLTIDRKDPRIGYSPENCRWANYGQQAMNTRRSGGAHSPFRGVRFYRGKWHAFFRRKSIGRFATALASALAWDAMAYAWDPVYYRLNFPERFKPRRNNVNSTTTSNEETACTSGTTT
jgi:hypothetical protein